MRVLTISWDSGFDITKITYNQEFSASDWIVRADVLQDAIGMLTEKYDALFTEKGHSGYKETKEELLAQQEGLTPRQGLEEYKKGYTKAEQDLKREPLSDDEIYVGFQSDTGNYLDLTSFTAGCKFSEKAHGIGVDDGTH
jgi:hypothetical protein